MRGRRARYALYAGGGVALGAVIWLLLAVGPRWVAGPAPADAVPEAQGTAPEAERKISATLFYVSPDGLGLVGVEREVPYGPTTSEQAQRIVEAQLAPPPPPLVSAVPRGTRLRALFITDTGDAFVDLSREVAAGHTGGSLEELFTIYSIVNAVSANLPSVSAVQILIEGQEVETLAGHVDLRHPLGKSLKWVQPHGSL